MKKLLYVTDLDGTLLNSKTELSAYSEHKLIYLINQNVNITVASLRSITTISQLFKNVPFQLPVIEMNGAFITDFKSHNKLFINQIDSTIKTELLSITRKHAVSPIIQCFHNGNDIMYIGELTNEGIKWYHENRKQYQDPRLRENLHIDDIMDISWTGITIIDEYNKLDQFRTEIHTKFNNVYTNITESYQTPGYHWYTLSSENSNKKKAITTLKNYLNMEDYYTVVFGDQPVDIPMFSVADLSIAVENAHSDVKKSADILIGSNDNDSVVNFIEKHCNEYHIESTCDNREWIVETRT